MSTPIVTRADYQALAEARLREAAALLGLGHWDGAYYLAGYAVELALKACIIKRVMATDAFLSKDFSRNCYTHDVEALLELADLEVALDAAADPQLVAYWGVVNRWSEQKRYHRMTEIEARALYQAIIDPTSGVFPWIKTHW